MKHEKLAKIFKELGHPVRLGIFNKLVRTGEAGLQVGALQAALEIPASTLSHHVSALVSAGLIEQRREGRTLYCVAQYGTLDAIVEFFQLECCIDEKNGGNTAD